MIFKTFDSKIDKWTSKIGIFGKSFNELGTAVNDAFKLAIDNIDNFGENVGFWKSLKNNLFSKKDNNKDWIKNSLGEIISKENIDNYIAELDLDSAKEKLTDIFDWEGLVNQNKKTWQDYFDTLDNGEKYIIDLIKNTDDLSKLTSEDLVKANQQARASALAHNEAIKAQTFSAKAGKVALKALATAGNMLAMWAISEAISGLYKLSQVSKDVAKSAKELGESFNGTKSDINDYKSKISDLYDTINDSNSSIEDVTNARQTLMSVQDELIDKFGTEKETIELITSAINNQSEALDTLTEKQWQVAKNDFNNGGFWNDVGNWVSGYEDNIDRMVSEMENVTKNIYLESLGNKNGVYAKNDELIHVLEKAGYDYVSEFENFQLSGTLEDVYSDILNIQQIAEEHNAPKEFLNALTKEANNAKQSLDDYGEMWDSYILRDRIFANENLADSWHEVTDAYSEYEKAFTSGNQNAIEKSIGDFSVLIKSILNDSGIDESVKDYFENMYPALKTEVDKWEFHAKILPEYDTHSLNGKNKADILGMLQEDGMQNGEETFNSILSLASKYGIVTGNNTEKINKLLDLLVEWGILQDSINDSAAEYPLETEISFTIGEYEEQIDNVQSTISSLRSALDSFNKGTLDESAVLDLMQKFPELIPYIDLAADGFGNLSEGLSILIAQQPDSLIQSLQTLKESLNTEEERAQVDALIDSLQSLSSYGDTGMEAYATAIGSTWTDTANVIQSVTDQFENLAKVQEAVADGLTISTSAAAELAKIYPEILTNAEYAGNGQIQLNEEVVKSILAGDQSIINAQITKLEADKAELEAKKSYAEAQLEMIKQVAEGEGNITKEVAQYRLDIANALLQALIEAGMEEDKAYAAVAANMAGNMDEFNRIVGEVAQDTSVNMDNAAVSMANSININSVNAQNSFLNLQKKVHDLADAIKAAANGEKAGSTGIYGGGGSTSSGGISTSKHTGDFNTSISDYTPSSINLKDFQSQLEIDIKGYEQAISNIDSQIEVLKNLQSTFADSVNSANGGIGGHNYADKIKDLEAEKDKINSSLNDVKSGSGSSKETKDEYEELFDFFERRVKVLDNALSLLKTNLDNVTGSFAKNKLIDAELGVTEEKFKNYSDALNMYTQKANEALSKLPSDIAAKVKDGAVDLTTFIGDGNKEVVEAIKDYEQWADKVADCKQELAELRTAIRQLELEKFNNIMEEFTNQFDLREDGKDLISKQIDLLKEAGQLIGESFFTTQIDQSKKQLELLEAEKAKLVEQMTSAVSSGRVQKGTNEWLEMVNALSDVEGNILDCKKAIEEFDNELLQLHWDIFDRIQGQFKDLDSELSNLRGLFDDLKVTDGNFNWSKEGLAQLGLLTQQYELAQYQVQQYNDAIDDLNAAYSAGKYSATEYVDKLSDLSKEQWGAVNSSESIKDAIIELNEVRIDEEIDAIEKEISAFKDLTNSLIENLRAQKDLHDYKKSIEEKSKDLIDIDRQIAAVQNDTSAAGIARLKLLQDQRQKAADELSELEYQHSIEAQEDALNKQYDDYKAERDKEIEALKASLEERETLIAQSFETVKANADLVGQEIAYIATQHGITVSDAIISSWQNGEQAIASYGDVLSAGTSAFIGNIMGVENEVYNLQSKANETANSLAWMFSTRADNLVNELASSYYSEDNLNYMTQALHDSLVNTLEGGYNISSIQSALDGIASGLNNVASAANNATSAMAAMGAAQERASMGAAQQTASNNTGKVVGGYSIHQVGAVNPSYTVRNGRGDIVSSGNTLKEAQDYLKSIHANGYASGTRNAKGGIRVVDEEGKELELPKLQSGRYAIGNEGDQILTKEQTDRIYEWSKLTPDELMMKLWKDNPDMGIIEPKVGRIHQPEIISSSVNNNSVNVHYDSVVQVNGDVHDANRIVKQIESVANDAIKKSWHDFEMTRKYGSY